MSIRSNVDARKFDQRIKLQRAVGTQDPDTGEVIVNFETVAEVWCAIDATKASERFAVAEIRSANSYTIWIRYRKDVQSKWRVLWGTRVMEITGIPDQQRRGRLLALFCEEGLTDG